MTPALTPTTQPRDARGRFAKVTPAPIDYRRDHPNSIPVVVVPPTPPEPKEVVRVILKGNRDVLGQVEKQSAMEAILSFLEMVSPTRVHRGQHCWLVTMPPIKGDTDKLMQGVLREGNIVGVARDPEQARDLGRRLVGRYDPEKDGTIGYGIIDAYAEKYYMFKDGWEIHDSPETVQEGH